MVEPDGRVRLAVTGAANFPDPVVGGVPVKRADIGSAGFLFYDEEVTSAVASPSEAASWVTVIAGSAR